MHKSNQSTRRDFIKKSSLTIGAIGVLGLQNCNSESTENQKDSSKSKAK